MSRAEDLDRLAGGEFDLLVVGGGIFGCWTALDAARRGLKVALVEQGDWGSGTSSCSSKLIHGGLRYLEHGWFSLVRKSLAERRTLLDIAPFRVRPLEFLLPIYEGTRFRPWLLRLGLWLYDRMSRNSGSIPRARRWSLDEFTGRHAWLKKAELRSAFSYGDAQVDDGRLTLEVALAARDEGALVLSRMRHNSTVGTTVHLTDRLGNDSMSCQADAIVMACGPWPAGDARPGTRRTKGVHLVMPALPDPVAVLLTSPRDGRVGFLIPWEDRTLVGTTDDDWHGDPGALEVTDAEAEYLLEMANSHLADPWGRNDIEGRFAGVRVLRAAKGNSASATTREWQLDREGSVFTTTGGKLTSSRLEAANTVDAVLEHLGRTTIPCRTDRPLPRTAEEPETWMSRAASEAADLGLDRECARALCRRYGTAVSRIFDLIRATPNLATRIHGSLPYVLAEVRHAIRFEEALDLEDILRRRIPLAILTSLDHETVEPVARIAADELGWDETRISAEIGRLTV